MSSINENCVQSEGKSVFFGHYWLKGAPKIENDSAICLDYSIAKDGILVAARLNQGEKPILIH
jgi:hypothetical protein